MISLIAAYNNNKVIGKDGKIPWRCSEDLKRFKQITMGSPVIMGRKTYESIGGPLPGRHNIIVSSGKCLYPVGVRVSNSVRAAIIGAQEFYGDEIFIIGGAEIYRQALPKAVKMYLTHIDDDSDGDTFFPDFESDDWEVTFINRNSDHTFRILERKTQ